MLSADLKCGTPTAYYDPVTARFTQPDTIVPGGGNDPQHLNRYSYVRNNPIRYNDPTGRETCGYRDGEYVCWNEVENIPGHRVEISPGAVDEGALMAPAHGPNGRCQSFCKRFSPERWVELQPPPNSFDLKGFVVELGQTMAVAGAATLALGVCGTGVGCVALAVGTGAFTEIATGEPIDCAQGDCLDPSDVPGDALEGALIGGTAAWLGPRFAAADGSERSATGVVGLTTSSLRSGAGLRRTAEVVASSVVETAEERVIVFVVRTARDELRSVVVPARDGGG